MYTRQSLVNFTFRAVLSHHFNLHPQGFFSKLNICSVILNKCFRNDYLCKLRKGFNKILVFCSTL